MIKKEPEYIDREQAEIMAIDGVDRFYKDENFDRELAIQEAIRRIPLANVEKVIRCKNCLYFVDYVGYSEHLKGTKRCNHPRLECDGDCYDFWVNADENGFCSYGEEKPDEDN